MEFFVSIKNGKIDNPRTVRKGFMLPDGRYRVRIDKFKKRSNLQNRYLHGVVVPLVFDGLRDAGFDQVRTHEDAKTVIKSLFLKKTITNDIETFEFIRDTHTLTTLEFMEFVSDVQRWAIEYLSVYIPDPSEQLKIF